MPVCDFAWRLIVRSVVMLTAFRDEVMSDLLTLNSLFQVFLHHSMRWAGLPCIILVIISEEMRSHILEAFHVEIPTVSFGCPLKLKNQAYSFHVAIPKQWSFACFSFTCSCFEICNKGHVFCSLEFHKPPSVFPYVYPWLQHARKSVTAEGGTPVLSGEICKCREPCRDVSLPSLI